MFEEISVFLKGFKIYRRIEQFTNVNIELKEATNKLLVCFVDICALCIQVLGSSKWLRVKIVAKKALFNDDSEIAKQLEHFRRLATHRSQISDAVTLEYVLSAQHDAKSSGKELFDYLKAASDSTAEHLDDISLKVDRVQASVDRQTDNGNAAHVRDLLAWLSTSDPSTYLDQAWQKHVEGTGEWVLDHPEFQAWTQGHRRTLLLHGVTGSGKTFLWYV